MQHLAFKDPLYAPLFGVKLPVCPGSQLAQLLSCQMFGPHYRVMEVPLSKVMLFYVGHQLFIHGHARYWQQHPRVRVWPYGYDLEVPDFSGCGPVVRGPLPLNHSLLFSVQVAHRLGFTRLIFLGCDFTSQELYPIEAVLREWWPAAKDAGFIWENASPVSMLQAWMPRCESGEWVDLDRIN